MPYSELLITPMRRDLTRYGVVEARTPEDVDRLLAPGTGTVLMITNSVCGCAAGRARPAVGMALRHERKPVTVATVFAGADEDAVDRLREILSDYPPSSPSMALFQDGKPIWMLPRREIERREAPEIAQLMIEAFDQFCGQEAGA